jgi:hypothetical protein
MILRGLLCAALLLAIPAMAQPDSAPEAAAPPASGAGAAMPEMRLECTPASRASELTGKHGCVAGRVFRVATTKHGDIHLSLCPSRSRGTCSFHVLVKARDSRNVGDLSPLRGEIVAVVGDVTEYRDHPVIVVRDKQQIRVAAGDAPAEFDAAQQRPGNRGIPGARGIPGVRDIPGVRSGRAW